MKCKKCGIYFKKKHKDKVEIYNELCFNCGVIWKFIGDTLKTIDKAGLNRVVSIHIDDIKIEKRIK